MTLFSKRIDPMLIQEIFQTPFYNNNNNNNKENPTGRWHARNTHGTQTGSSGIFKRMVPVDYSYQSKKEVSGTFSFTCLVTALPGFNRGRLTLCTALSISPPGHPGLPATTCNYVVGLLPVELNVIFILVLRR